MECSFVDLFDNKQLSECHFQSFQWSIDWRQINALHKGIFKSRLSLIKLWKTKKIINTWSIYWSRIPIRHWKCRQSPQALFAIITAHIWNLNFRMNTYCIIFWITPRNFVLLWKIVSEFHPCTSWPRKKLSLRNKVEKADLLSICGPSGLNWEHCVQWCLKAFFHFIVFLLAGSDAPLVHWNNNTLQKLCMCLFFIWRKYPTTQQQMFYSPCGFHAKEPAFFFLMVTTRVNFVCFWTQLTRLQTQVEGYYSSVYMPSRAFGTGDS